MPRVAIVLGSKTDEEIVLKSGMLKIFDRTAVSWAMSVISAHRNPEDIADYCKKSRIEIFIGIASMAAALPGAIAAATKGMVPVIGVPLPSSAFGIKDALFSMIQMPSGLPVLVPGTGADKSGLVKAAIAACQMLALYDSDVRHLLSVYLESIHKSAEIEYKKSALC